MKGNIPLAPSKGGIPPYFIPSKCSLEGTVGVFRYKSQL